MLQDVPEDKKTFLLKFLDRLLQGAMAPSPKEMSQMAGSKLWQRYGKRLMTSSLFLGMAFQAFGEMMLRNEGWMSESIAAITCYFPFINLLQIMEWFFITVEKIEMSSCVMSMTWMGALTLIKMGPKWKEDCLWF